MATIKVYNMKGSEVGTMELNESVFGVEYKEAVIHQAVVTRLANERQGTKSTLTRSEVRGGGIKPWRQKGTGRARSGMTSSPVWRGGGRAFPNIPNENFSQKVNKKMYRAAMASIYSKLVAEGRLVVVDSIAAETPKTKAFAQKLKSMGLESAMIITNEVDENLFLASRNLKNVLVVMPRYADPLSLIFYKKVVVTKDAVAKLEEMWG